MSAQIKPVIRNFPIKVFGSGDAGSIALSELLQDKNVPFFFNDIRYVAPDGSRPHLIEVGKWRPRTMPYSITPDGTVIGGYEETVAYIEGKGY